MASGMRLCWTTALPSGLLPCRQATVRGLHKRKRQPQVDQRGVSACTRLQRSRQTINWGTTLETAYLATAFITSSYFAQRLLLGGRTAPSDAERWCRVVTAGHVRRCAGGPRLCRPPGSHRGALREREEQLTRLNAVHCCFCRQEDLQKQTALKRLLQTIPH